MFHMMAALVREADHSHVHLSLENREGVETLPTLQCWRMFLTVSADWAVALLCRMMAFPTSS
jgi:hypothetical protein